MPRQELVAQRSSGASDHMLPSPASGRLTTTGAQTEKKSMRLKDNTLHLKPTIVEDCSDEVSRIINI
mgnify:CR=1 FL=1